MTVLLFCDDIGIALSDTLTSIDSRGMKETPAIQLPTVGVDVTSNLRFSPTSLKRKKISISHGSGGGEFLVSGTVSHIKKLASNIAAIRSGLLSLSEEQLRKFNPNSSLSIIETACLFTEDTGHGDFEVIGVCDGVRFSRQYNNKIVAEIPYFGRVTLSGSGAPSLLRWLDERGQQFVKMDVGNDTLIQKQHRVSNWLPAMLLEEDWRDQHRTLSEGVGGYYEVFSFNNTTLDPLDSVVTVFASIEGSISDPKITLEKLFFHRYEGECLSVISFLGGQKEFSLGEAIRISIKDFELFNILSICGDQSKPNSTSSRLASEMNSARMFRLSLFRDKGDGDVYQVKRIYSSEYKILTSNVQDGNVHIKMNNDLLQSYIKKFPKSPPRGEHPIFSS